MEGQELNNSAVVEVELEEDIIPNEIIQNGGLNDVIPCDYVEVKQQEIITNDMAGSSVDGLYDDMGYVAPSVPTNQMVDIASDVVINTEVELEEENIPNEHNTNSDSELNDVQ